MAVETRVGEEQYRRLALAEPDRTWELWDGLLREKPAMTAAHNWIAERVAYLLRTQLDWKEFQARSDKGRVQRPASTFFIPDVFVVPTAMVRPLLDRQDLLESYHQPLPLVVEVWFPSTGGYDVDAKLPEYRRRGDLEIWRIHPYERTLTAWVRQPDGSDVEETHRQGTFRPAALPGVAIDLGALCGI